jgi:hypothetical protein
MFLPYGASSEIVFENCSSVAMMCDLIATCMMACRPTPCASAAAEALQRVSKYERSRAPKAVSCKRLLDGGAREQDSVVVAWIFNIGVFIAQFRYPRANLPESQIGMPAYRLLMRKSRRLPLLRLQIS